MKKAVTLTMATIMILSLCFAITDEAFKGITEIREINRSSDNPLCSDICMKDGTVYILNSSNDGYAVSLISGETENLLKLTNDAGTYSSNAMLSVSGNSIYVLDNDLGAILSYTKDGNLTGTHKLPEGKVTSFDTLGDKAYMQFEKRITLSAYDLNADALTRSYLYDDGFGGNHYPSCVSVCSEDNTLRLSRISDEFLIETFDTLLNPDKMEKTTLPFKAVEFDASKPAGDLVVNGMIAGKKYDYAPHVSGRFNGSGSSLFPAEIYRFKTGKKYPDMIYKIKGMNNFKGYLKLLGMDGDSFVLYIHDENGSASRSLSGEAKTGDFLIKVAI